jgi:hypothetical protein
MVAAPFVVAAAATVGVEIAVTSFAATAGAFAINLAISAGLSYAAMLMVPSEEEPKGAVQKRPRVGTQVPRCMIFGTVATAGQIVHDNVFGSDNRQLQVAYALADHECVEILGLVADGKTLNTSTYAGPGGMDYEVESFKQRFQFSFRTGTEDQNVFAPFVTQSNPSGRFSNDHRLRSVATVFAKYEYRGNIFPSKTPPQSMWIVKGGLWYDPRKDSTQPGGSGAHRWNNKATWEYTANPFVCLYNYLRGLWVNGVLWVGAGLDDDELDLESFMVAANVCDEIVTNPDSTTRFRYRMALIAEGGRNANHRKVMDDVMLATAGIWTMRSGKIWVCAGAARTPVTSITDDDLMPAAPIRMTPKRSADGGLVNELYGTYTSPEMDWQAKELPVLRDQDDFEADGGRLENSIDWSMVTDKFQARSLQKTMYKRSRKQISATVTVRPHLIGVEPGDVIEWTSAKFGWTKNFLVTDWEDHDAELLDATWTLQEYDGDDYQPSIDDWVQNDDILPGSSDGSVEVENFAWTIDYTVGSNDRKQARAVCTWTPPDDDTIDAIIIQVRRDDDPTWVETRFDDPEAGTATVRSGLGPKGKYRLRASWIRSEDRSERVWSDEVEAGDDNFGDDDGGDIDTTPPGVPTGLTVTYDNVISVDGVNELRLKISWNAVTDEDLFGYEVGLQRGLIGTEEIVPAPSRYVERVVQADNYIVRVRAVDTSNNRSAFTSTITINVTNDTVPPAAPTGVVATGGLGALFVKWVRNAEPDMNFYELFISATSTPAPVLATAATAQVAANDWSRSGYGPNETWHLWVRAVDRAGNRSAWSSRVQATTRKLLANEITDGVINAPAFASGITPVEIVSSLPTTGNYQGRTVTLTTDGKLYRYHSGAWTAAVPTVDLTGQVTGAQITNAAIDSTKLLDGAVLAAKLADNAVTVNKIAAGAVSGVKLAAGFGSNMVFNSDFRTSLQGWGITYNDTTLSADFARNLSADYTLVGAGTAYTTVAGSPAAGKLVNVSSRQIPIVAGRRYEVSAYLNAHRCNGYVFVVWIDASGANLTSNTGNAVSVQAFGKQLSQYGRSTLFATAPVGAVTMVVGFQLQAVGGQANPYLFATLFLAAEALANQTEPSAWAPGIDVASLTELSGQIVGTQISDNAITAPLIAANAITSDKISANSVIAGKIAANAVTANELAANSVTAGKVAANAITAGTIAAGAVTAGTIAAGAVVAVSIAADAVTANAIAANAITAVKIAAAAVTAGKIAANAVTANEIAANAITSDKIFANAVTAGKIAAGAVSATEIAADSITARHLVLTDLTNMILNGDFSAGSEKWSFPPNTIVQSVGSTEVTGSFRIRTIDRYVQSADYEATVNEQYTAWAYVYNTGTATCQLLVQFTDDAGVVISNAVAASTTLKGQWVRLAGQVQVPTGANKFRILLDRGQGSAVEPAFFIYWGKIQARRAAGANLIVDGAVTALKVATGTLEAIAATIGTAWITSAHIVDLNASKLQAGTITADKIGVGQVTGPKLAVGPGINQLYNSTFRYSLNRWTTGGNTGLTIQFARNLAGYTPVGGTMAYIRAVGTPANGTVFDAYNDVSTRYSVVAGLRYEMSAYLGAHRCNAYAIIAWYNSVGTYLGETAGSVVANGAAVGGTQLSTFGRSVVFGTAPTGATMALPFIRGICVGTADPYVMMTRIYFGEAFTNQSEPSGYADGPSDQDFTNMVGQITGVQIENGAVIAAKIAANTITSDKIGANEIKTVNLDTNSVVASKILAGEINATKISINGVEVQNIKGEAATVMRVNRINNTAGNENAVPINTITVISRQIPRTLGTKMLLICSFKVETSANSTDRSTNVKVYRDGSNVFDRSFTIPYQGEQDGEKVYYGEIVFIWYDDDLAVGTTLGDGTATDYEVTVRVPEISNRQLTLMEFRR